MVEPPPGARKRPRWDAPAAAAPAPGTVPSAAPSAAATPAPAPPTAPAPPVPAKKTPAEILAGLRRAKAALAQQKELAARAAAARAASAASVAPGPSSSSRPPPPAAAEPEPEPADALRAYLARLDRADTAGTDAPAAAGARRRGGGGLSFVPRGAFRLKAAYARGSAAAEAEGLGADEVDAAAQAALKEAKREMRREDRIRIRAAGGVDDAALEAEAAATAEAAAETRVALEAAEAARVAWEERQRRRWAPPEGAAGGPADPGPGVEWWDARLLPRGLPPGGGYAALPLEEGAADPAAGGDLAPHACPYLLRPGAVVGLVEHPPPVPPPGVDADAPPPPPPPVRLVPREIKKLRTQRRRAREQERQDLVARGLIEAPAPRVRLANLHRVLGAEARPRPSPPRPLLSAPSLFRSLSPPRRLPRAVSPASSPPRRHPRPLPRPLFSLPPGGGRPHGG